LLFQLLPGQLHENYSPPALEKGQKKLDFFFEYMLTKVSLNEYSFSMNGGAAKKNTTGNINISGKGKKSVV
jgi:hypothetical protein